jgi:hypothetical protein
MGLVERGGELETSGHSHIQQKDIGLVVLQPGEREAGFTDAGDDTETQAAEQFCEGFPIEPEISGDQDAHHGALGAGEATHD